MNKKHPVTPEPNGQMLSTIKLYFAGKATRWLIIYITHTGPSRSKEIRNRLLHQLRSNTSRMATIIWYAQFVNLMIFFILSHLKSIFIKGTRIS